MIVIKFIRRTVVKRIWAKVTTAFVSEQQDSNAGKLPKLRHEETGQVVVEEPQGQAWSSYTSRHVSNLATNFQMAASNDRESVSKKKIKRFSQVAYTSINAEPFIPNSQWNEPLLADLHQSA